MWKSNARLKEELRAAGLLKFVDPEQEQFLQFPDGFFAELVLNDGSKVAEVESVIRGVKERLRTEGVELDEIVRPVWSVAKIERMGRSVSFPGLEPAVRFRVILQSGSLSCTVEVDVTEAALGMIRERLNETKAPEDAALQEIVSEFMKMQLSHGGRSYWDPRRDSRLELNAAAMMYLFGRRDAYERLKQSIDEIFNPTVGSRKQRKEIIESFVRSMSYAHGGRKIRRFQDALTDLPGPGGAYKPDQRLSTSNYELYELLFDDEKRDLEAYYLDQVAKAEKEFPHLKSEVPAVFN